MKRVSNLNIWGRRAEICSTQSCRERAVLNTNDAKELHEMARNTQRYAAHCRKMRTMRNHDQPWDDILERLTEHLRRIEMQLVKIEYLAPSPSPEREE